MHDLVGGEPACHGGACPGPGLWKTSPHSTVHAWHAGAPHQQLWMPQGLCWHWLRAASLPVHFKLSSQMGPVPAPAEPRAMTMPGPGRPSCRHLHSATREGGVDGGQFGASDCHTV